MDFMLCGNLLADGPQLLILRHLGVHLEFLNQKLFEPELFFDGSQFFGGHLGTSPLRRVFPKQYAHR